MLKEIRVKADMANLDTVLGFLEEELELAECPMKLAMKIVVCVEELYVNIVSYAYDGAEGECTIGLERDDKQPDKIRIIISDSGKYFNPLNKEDPDITLTADERDMGGLGIFMVKNIMDAISYERNNGNNIIIMEKSWNI